MSAHYSSHNVASRCQRCGVPLFLNDAHCANCGFYNGVPPANKSQQQQTTPPTWNVPNAQVQQNSLLQQARQQSQPGDVFKNYVASAEQGNRYVQPSSQVSNTGPTTPPTSFGTPPQSWSHVGIAQPSARNAQTTSSGPQTGNLSPTYAQSQPPFREGDKLQRRSRVGRIVGISALLVALISASFLAYTFLFAQKSTPTGSTSLQAAPTNSVPLGNPLFQDNFTNNNNGWNIQSYPDEFAVSLGNGSLKLENDSNKLLWELLPGTKTYSDFQISVDASLSKGSQDNGYGVYIRGALSQNMTLTSFYRFELYGDGSFAIFKGTTDANGITTTPRLVDYTNNSAILKQGELNHITISAKGSTMQLVVNNQVLSTVTDTTYTSGAIALFVSNLQNARPGAEATFSHLAVYPAQE
jgi:ribosomal protein L37E